MRKQVSINGRMIGDGHPCYIIGEIGINHNGDIEIAKKLIDVAAESGCDAVKFQKRTPEVVVPPEEREKMRDTPWGYITYMEYRYKVEFGEAEYAEIDRHCKEKGIAWFASPWDEASVDFLEQFNVGTHKVASACLTDLGLLKHLRATGKPLIVSTGMSTVEQIDRAIDLLGTDNLVLMHTTSTYPCPPEELNLRMVETMRAKYDCPIGYSGHEAGLPTTVAAVVLGACAVERHITLDRSMWGSDHAASIEPGGLERLVHYIRVVESALGDGVKQVYESEKTPMKRLRRVDNTTSSR
ncbi:MAG: N-acetylneuraminate synthase family protein [Chloroflexota bacterium]